jgi:hypothetical protein
MSAMAGGQDVFTSARFDRSVSQRKLCCDATIPQEDKSTRFDWAAAARQSGLLLGIQHSLRMAQEKTREHLDGPFWHDYLNSVSAVGMMAIP